MQNSFDLLYETDETLTIKGAKLLIGINKKGQEMSIMVAQDGNDQHLAAIRKREKMIEQMRHDKDGVYKIRCAIVAEGLVRGWAGVLDGDGNEMPYTEEDMVETLLRHKRLFMSIIDFSGDISNYRPISAITAEQDSAGN